MPVRAQRGLKQRAKLLVKRLKALGYEVNLTPMPACPVRTISAEGEFVNLLTIQVSSALFFEGPASGGPRRPSRGIEKSAGEPRITTGGFFVAPCLRQRGRV